MADDNLSASQLRSKYGAGGTASDAELSARQLRARYGIQSNRKDFSTSDQQIMPLLYLAATSGLILAIVSYFFFAT